MGRAPQIIEFDPYEPDIVLDCMETILERRRGWVNFEPRIPEEQGPPETGGVLGVLSNRGPLIPLCTWTPPEVSRKGAVGPQTIGIQHALGAKARPRLTEVKLEVPAGWLVRGDHPKRGMVLELPADEAVATVLDWLLAAGEALVTVPVTGRWTAVVYPG